MSAKIRILNPYYLPFGMPENDYEGIVHANMCIAAILEQEDYDELCNVQGVKSSYPLSAQMNKMVKEEKISEIKDSMMMTDYYYFTEEQHKSWMVNEVFPSLQTGLLMAAKIRYMSNKGQ